MKPGVQEPVDPSEDVSPARLFHVPGSGVNGDASGTLSSPKQSAPPKPHALLVDDDQGFSTILAKLVEQEGFTASMAGTLAEARACAAERLPNVVFVDLMLPDGSGFDLLKDLDHGPHPEVVAITGFASVDTAVEALRRGVSDYLTKPVDVGRVKAVLANVARALALREEIDALRAELRELGHFGRLVGASEAMGKVYDLICRVAPTDATVLVTGESGTGKDLVAQTIHELSRRRRKSFVPVNCGAISPNLIESELFGHERGSFTGAERLHKGCFERADGGTLFLDEVVEMPIELQTTLLRVLETGSVIRIGGERSVQVNVRVIAATNRDLDEAVRTGKLREDLLYRLNVFPIRLPPLRERGDDVELLAVRLIDDLNKSEGTDKRLSRAAVQQLRKSDWLGNVRELKNVIHRAFIMTDGEIGTEFIPQKVRDTPTAIAPAPEGTAGNRLEEAERGVILATLDQCAGDKKAAAKVLGISLKTLYKRLRSYKRSQLGEAPDEPGPE